MYDAVTNMDADLQRLTRLLGSDAGFYVLALHSFVEHYIRDVLEASDAERFSDLVWEYRDQLMEEAGGGFVQGLNCLSSLGRQHKYTSAYPMLPMAPCQGRRFPRTRPSQASILRLSFTLADQERPSQWTLVG